MSHLAHNASRKYPNNSRGHGGRPFNPAVGAGYHASKPGHLFNNPGSSTTYAYNPSGSGYNVCARPGNSSGRPTSSSSAYNSSARPDNSSARPDNSSARPDNSSARRDNSPGSGYNSPGSGYNSPGSEYNSPGSNSYAFSYGHPKAQQNSVQTKKIRDHPGCVLCYQNKETKQVYLNHKLKDSKGNITCPILYKTTCRYCGATGKDAHTQSYCRLNPGVPNFRYFLQGTNASGGFYKQ